MENTETRRLFFVSILDNLRLKFAVPKAVSEPAAEIATEKDLLENKLCQKASVIHKYAREHGVQKHGPKWSELKITLPDGRIIDIQASLDRRESRLQRNNPLLKRGEKNHLDTLLMDKTRTLGISFPSSDPDIQTAHLRYILETFDKKPPFISSYEVRRPDSSAIIYYNWSASAENIPPDLCYESILNSVQDLLNQTENAIKLLSIPEPE